MREQDGWDGHAAFMDGLAGEGIIVLGGPVGEGDRRFLLAVEADSASDVERILAADPWVPSGQLAIEAVEPWQLLLRAGAHA
jgi:uncharacterized protein YciI